MTASPRQAWAAGIRQVHEESGGLLSLRFVSADDALDLIAASLGGDREATRLMATVTRVLARIGSMPKRAPALCGCCPRPLRRSGYIVCLAVPERADPENCVGFGICERCSADKTKLDEKALEALGKLFPAVRSLPQLFDAYGASIPPGGPALATLDLHQWPGNRMIFSTCPAVIGLMAIFSDDRPDVQADVIARAVACLELGQSVVVHAPDDAAAQLAAARIESRLSGGHV